MKTPIQNLLIATSLAFALSACSVVPTQFGGSSPMPAERQSSAAIDLARPLLSTESSGALVVTGYLSRKRGAVTTANSHVVVQFLDSTGSILLETSVLFTPQDLGGGSVRSRPHAKYQLTVAALPAGTVRLRVVAHDNPHT